MMDEYKKELDGIQMSEERKAKLEELLASEIEAAAVNADPAAPAEDGAAADAVVDGVVPMTRKRRSRRSVRVAVAVAACLALGCGAAYGAANYAGFFDGAFGTGWRSSAPAEDVIDDGDLIRYPASDAVVVDQDEAGRLLGNAVSDDSATIEWPDGHVLTVDHMVRSSDAAVYRFTLHRDGGVTALDWDEGANRSKGAAPAEGCDYAWHVGDDDFIYVDPDASTSDTLVGYGYTVFEEALAAGEPVELSVEPRAWGHEGWQGETAEITCAQTLTGSKFAGSFGIVDVTPIGLVLHGDVKDPGNIGSVVVNFKDGTSYTVQDEDARLDNTLAACGYDDRLAIDFNRLVDPSDVANVTLKVIDPETNKEQTVVLE